MQRQAVPLVITEAPLIGTGMESNVAKDSGEALVSPIEGEVMMVDGTEITIQDTTINKKVSFEVKKFKRSNQATSVNQKPIVSVGEKIKIVQAGDTVGFAFELE